MRASFILPVCFASLLLACSAADSTLSPSDGGSSSGDDAGGVSTSNGDGGAGSSKDSGAGSHDGGAPSEQDASMPKDSGAPAIDAGPFACVTAATPKSCAHGPSMTGFAQSTVAASGHIDDFFGGAAFDVGGVAHVVSTHGSTVSYSTNKTGAWTTSLVASPKGLPNESLSQSGLAVDACGKPYVGYVRSYLPAGTSTYDTRLSILEGSASGFVESVMPLCQKVEDAQIAVDKSGALHVLWDDYTQKPSHAVAPFASADQIPYFDFGAPAFAMSASGPEIVYADSSDLARANLAENPGTGWASALVTSSTQTGIGVDVNSGSPHIRVAVGADGSVHVAWVSATGTIDETTYVVRYAVRPAGASAFNTPEVIGSYLEQQIWSLSLAIDASGTPSVVYVAYANAASSPLVYARRGATTWSTSSIVTSYDQLGAAFAIDPNGLAHVFGVVGDAMVTWTQPCAP